MKKMIDKKIIFGIIIGMILMYGIGVGATYIYQASQVSYKNSNVDDTLNDLYDTITRNNDTDLVEKAKESPEVISYIVSSLYNGEKKSYNISGKSINCASFSGMGECLDSFSFDSGIIKIYETPDGKAAVLNSIAISVSNSNSHSNYSYEQSSSSSSYAVTLEDGKSMLSGATVNNTFSLFNYSIGTNKTLRITASASIRTHGAPPSSVGAYASASIGTITLTYILM